MRWPRSGPRRCRRAPGSPRDSSRRNHRARADGRRRGTPSMRGSPGSSAKSRFPRYRQALRAEAVLLPSHGPAGARPATMLGRPCASTSNLQGMTKRCVPARSPATRRSCGRSRVTVKPIDTAHPGLNRGPCSRRSVRMRRMASSSGAALSRPSPAVNAVGRSGSSLFDAHCRPGIVEDVPVRIVVVCLGPVLAPHRGGHHRVGRARGRACHCGELGLAGRRAQVTHGSPGQAGLVVAEARRRR